MTRVSTPRLPKEPPEATEGLCTVQATIEVGETEIVIRIPIHIRTKIYVGPGNLTRREREVLEALGPLRDRTNKEIGQALNLSERAIKFHIQNLMAKMGVDTRHKL
jgi:DNA-binding NarL/FixJ family response regulator